MHRAHAAQKVGLTHDLFSCSFASCSSFSSSSSSASSSSVYLLLFFLPSAFPFVPFSFLSACSLCSRSNLIPWPQPVCVLSRFGIRFAAQQLFVSRTAIVRRRRCTRAVRSTRIPSAGALLLLFAGFFEQTFALRLSVFFFFWHCF